MKKSQKIKDSFKFKILKKYGLRYIFIFLAGISFLSSSAHQLHDQECRLFLQNYPNGSHETVVTFSDLPRFIRTYQLFSSIPWTVTNDSIEVDGLKIIQVLSSDPRLDLSGDQKILYWPKKGVPQAQNVLLQGLVGTEYHPYNKKDGPLILKESQQEALKIIEEARKKGLDRLLLVAPPGFGKTELVDKYLINDKSPGLKLIITDRTLNVRSISDAVV